MGLTGIYVALDGVLKAGRQHNGISIGHNSTERGSFDVSEVSTFPLSLGGHRSSEDTFDQNKHALALIGFFSLYPTNNQRIIIVLLVFPRTIV